MSARTIAAGFACLVFPILAAAQSAQLNLPSFEHLQKQATESVDITVSGWPLGLAALMMDEDDPQSAEVKEMLGELKAVHLRSYEFAADFVYSKADVDAVRQQLTAPGWSQLVQIRNRNQNSDLDVYISLDGDKVNGLAILASEPRQLTILNIVGSIDPSKLEKLEGHLGLPKLGVEQMANRSQ